MREDGVNERRRAEILHSQTSAMRQQMEIGHHQVSDGRRQLAEQQRLFETERLNIAEDRRRAAEERASAAQCADEARSVRLKAAEQMRASAAPHPMPLLSAADGTLTQVVRTERQAHTTAQRARALTSGHSRPPSAPSGGPASRHREVLTSVRVTLREIGIDLTQLDADGSQQVSVAGGGAGERQGGGRRESGGNGEGGYRPVP
jgi:hypothetical protein